MKQIISDPCHFKIFYIFFPPKNKNLILKYAFNMYLCMHLDFLSPNTHFKIQFDMDLWSCNCCKSQINVKFDVQQLFGTILCTVDV